MRASHSSMRSLSTAKRRVERRQRFSEATAYSSRKPRSELVVTTRPFCVKRSTSRRCQPGFSSQRPILAGTV
jgi:hypothetical protein